MSDNIHKLSAGRAEPRLQPSPAKPPSGRPNARLGPNTPQNDWSWGDALRGGWNQLKGNKGDPGWTNLMYRSLMDDRGGVEGWSKLRQDVETDRLNIEDENRNPTTNRWDPSGGNSWLGRAMRYFSPRVPGLNTFNRPRRPGF